MKFTAHVDVSRWTGTLGELRRRAQHMTPAFREIGEVVLNRVKQNFQSSGGKTKWAPLAPSTLVARARGVSGRGRVYTKSGRATARASKIMGSAKPLIWTGRLLRSMTYRAGANFVDVGTVFAYARRLFFGSREGVTPITPARNPYGLDESDHRAIEGIIGRYLLNGKVR